MGLPTVGSAGDGRFDCLVRLFHQIAGNGKSDRPRCHHATHHRLQLTEFRVKDKELSRQRRLVIEHVDQQAEGAQIVAQAIKRARHGSKLDVDLGDQHLFDAVAHADDRHRRLIQSEHRQHTPHLCHQARDRRERRRVLRIPEELIQGLFRLGQCRTQLAHDRPHGLAVADPAIQLFHPRFQRLGAAAGANLLQAHSQSIGPLGQLTFILIAVGQGRFQVQHGSRYFQGDLGARRLSGSLRDVRRMLQAVGEPLAARMKFDDRVRDQAELVADVLESRSIPAGQTGPGLLDCFDALARL